MGNFSGAKHDPDPDKVSGFGSGAALSSVSTAGVSSGLQLHPQSSAPQSHALQASALQLNLSSGWVSFLFLCASLSLGMSADTRHT